MININKYINWKLYLIIIFLIILACTLIYFFFNLNLKKAFNAILEVDENKTFILVLENSNIEQINTSKNVYLNLENKIYLLENIELISLGNNKYAIKFENDDLFDNVKTHSIFNVKILLGSKNIFNIIFNI